MRRTARYLALGVVIAVSGPGCGMSDENMMQLSDAGAVASVGTQWSGPSTIQFGREGKVIDDRQFEALMPALQAAPKLRSLKLAGMSLTDDSITQILLLKNLVDLDLRATHISAGAMSELRALSRLRNLQLSDQYSKAEIQELSDSLKGVAIEIRAYPEWYDRAYRPR